MAVIPQTDNNMVHNAPGYEREFFKGLYLPISKLVIIILYYILCYIILPMLGSTALQACSL